MISPNRHLVGPVPNDPTAEMPLHAYHVAQKQPHAENPVLSAKLAFPRGVGKGHVVRHGPTTQPLVFVMGLEGWRAPLNALLRTSCPSASIAQSISCVLQTRPFMFFTLINLSYTASETSRVFLGINVERLRILPAAGRVPTTCCSTATARVPATCCVANSCVFSTTFSYFRMSLFVPTSLKTALAMRAFQSLCFSAFTFSEYRPSQRRNLRGRPTRCLLPGTPEMLSLFPSSKATHGSAKTPCPASSQRSPSLSMSGEYESSPLELGGFSAVTSASSVVDSMFNSFFL